MTRHSTDVGCLYLLLIVLVVMLVGGAVVTFGIWP